MFNKVLIISDNAPLCRQFFEIIERKQLRDVGFSFAISPYSNKALFNIGEHIEIKVFDLRDQETVEEIKANYNLVFSMHCKQIFPADLVKNIRCINIHPGYNPINRGWYPQVFSIINNFPVGATIHEIDEKLDHGNIIAREFVTKSAFDTSESLYNKITAKEIELLEANLENILYDNYDTIAPESEGNLYLKKDFNELLKLDLAQQTSVGDFIDKLRALTHGTYDNAYFIDPESGRKVYVGIRLKPEEDA